MGCSDGKVRIDSVEYGPGPDEGEDCALHHSCASDLIKLYLSEVEKLFN